MVRSGSINLKMATGEHVVLEVGRPTDFSMNNRSVTITIRGSVGEPIELVAEGSAAGALSRLLRDTQTRSQGKNGLSRAAKRAERRAGSRSVALDLEE